MKRFLFLAVLCAICSAMWAQSNGNSDEQSAGELYEQQKAKLQQVKSLYEEGLISEEDYNSAKNKILEGLTLEPTTMTTNPQNVAHPDDYITRQHRTYYFPSGVSLSEEQYADFIKKGCPNAYQQYKKGDGLVGLGWILLAAGLGLDAGSIAAAFVSDSSIKTPICASLASGATLFELACIPTLIVGYHKKHASVDVYNQHCTTPTAYWSINAGSNGLGIAYHF